MTEFEPARRPKNMAAVIEGIASILSTMRARRAKVWGKPKGPTLSSTDEALLAAIFQHANDPVGVDDDIVVTLDELSRHWATKATLRISVRRLVQLDYLKEGRVSGEYAPLVSVTPTPKAWEWATNNEERIVRILKPPAPTKADDDIPF
jgi:hypothetical protein